MGGVVIDGGPKAIATGLVIRDVVLVAIIDGSIVGNTIITAAITKATISRVGYCVSITGPPAPTALVVEPLFLMIFLKNFTCHT